MIISGKVITQNALVTVVDANGALHQIPTTLDNLGKPYINIVVNAPDAVLETLATNDKCESYPDEESICVPESTMRNKSKR